ncbi:methyltransferase RsmF C-terminal domain-like protein [Xanthovirga aplysinae]|uniref:methyltransferase RsmF C-terminal domain-like protein n=1 Tax=Xanthovirga aplysinae TaxID=2529853 RepID=UPI0012BBFF9F|nr:rRNA methyltransferase [Xanthovirga aplysinae]MTI29810.1 rRNA methyltransferase [Xanthovirga aplysinae]
MILPEAFEKRMKEKLGNAFPAFQQALEEDTPVSIRLNCKKWKVFNFPQTVPWTTDGFYLEKRPKFTLDPLFHAGAYYVQEASSMFLEQAFKQHVDLEESLNVLDLCAAPGGKSTHLASLISEDSLLVSNEVIKSRSSILAENMCKWGSGNVLVTNNDPKDFNRLAEFFDVMVVDAPCSGEGMFRKDPGAVTEWSEENVKLCAQRQQRILMDVWDALRPGGVLIYSTCTYNQLENEDNISWLLDQKEAESLKIETDPQWNVTAVEEKSQYSYHFYPHQNKGEGFFLTVLRKKGEWQPPSTKKKSKKSLLQKASKQEQQALNGWLKNEDPWAFIKHKDTLKAFPKEKLTQIEKLYKNLRVVYGGTELAELKRKNIRPSHQLAMFQSLNKENFQHLEVDKKTALQFLSKGDLQLHELPKDWALITFEEIPLGWVKRAGNRLNTYYPKEWRIRMDISSENY